MVVIFRDHLLPISESFIATQAEHLTEFRPVFVGSRRVPGIPIRDPVLINNGGIVGVAREVLFKLLGFSGQVRRTLQSASPNLVHAHFGPDGVRALGLASRLHVPLVVTLHGFDVTVSDEAAASSFYGHREYVRRRTELGQRATRLIAVSQFLRKKMVERGLPDDKITVHYIGVDTERFCPSAGGHRGSNVLFVGRLIENKGCDHLIRALARARHAGAQVQLDVVGDGPQRSHLEQLAARLRVPVNFLGAKPSDEVSNLMQTARVVSVPSLTVESGASEAFGMALLEAQACGTPVVSYSSGGIPEAVQHGRSGLLADEGDERGLALHLMTLLSDNRLWARMSESAIERTRSQFDIRKQTRRLEEIYNEAAVSAPPERAVGSILVRDK